MLTLSAGGQMVEAHTRNIKSIWNPLALLIQHSSCLEGQTISTQMPTDHSDSATNWEILAAPEWGGQNGLARVLHKRSERGSDGRAESLSHTHTRTHTRPLWIQTGIYHESQV